MISNNIKSASKALVSIGILTYLLWQIPVQEVAATIPRLGIAPAAALSGLLALEVFLSTLSIFILATYYTDLTFCRMFKIDAANFIANIFIPSRLGSVISMPVLIDRYTSANKAEGAVIQTTQMVIVTVVTGGTAGVGWLIFQDMFSTEMSLTLALCVALYLGFPVAVVAGILLSDVAIVRRHIISRLPIPEVQQGTRIDPRRLLASSGCLIAARVIVAAARLWILSIVFGLDLGLLEMLFVPVLMYSVTVLPISLGGIGVAEASGTAVISALGVPVAVAATVVFIDRIFTTYLPLVGFYTYVNLTGLPDRVVDNNTAR